MSMTTTPQVTRQIELTRAVLEGRHAGVRKLLGLAGAHRRRRRRRPQESEGPRDRLRPAHQADRARPQASDVCRQARGVQRADRASRRGRDRRAGHHRARHQRGVRRPERGNPLQRRGRLGRAVSPRISAARDRRHRPPDRAPPDRRRIFPRHPGDRDLRRRPRRRSTAIRPRSGCPGATASARTCWTRSFAPARWRTGWSTRCCRRAPSAGGAKTMVQTSSNSKR